MKTTVLGCIGHFIDAKNCQFRLHTQIGTKYRVSTVGDYFPYPDGKRQPLGATPDGFFETMVFKTRNTEDPRSEGCGCLEVEKYNELASERYPTAGDARKGHEKYVAYWKMKAEMQKKS